jgi:alpha-beta hydrolase superfamily lysophospholipase
LENGLDVNGLSHDPEVVKKYVEDPLVHPMVSTRLGMFIIAGAQDVMANASKWKYPLLLMHGTEDRLALVNGSDQFVKLIHGDITYKRWEGLYHEIHNEPQKDEVFKMTLDWIDKHL